MPATRLPARIWPRTPSPLGPSRSGSLYRPAARMIGVASRNAKRAASSWSRPRASPATMVTPERLMPAKKARIWVAPISSASRKARVESSREGGSPVRVKPVMGWRDRLVAAGCAELGRVGPGRRDGVGGAAAELLAGQQDGAVAGQEDRRGQRFGEQGPQGVLEADADQPGGDGGHHQQPAEPLVGRLDASMPQRAEQPG